MVSPSSTSVEFVTSAFVALEARLKSYLEIVFLTLSNLSRCLGTKMSNAPGNSSRINLKACRIISSSPSCVLEAIKVGLFCPSIDQSCLIVFEISSSS